MIIVLKLLRPSKSRRKIAKTKDYEEVLVRKDGKRFDEVVNVRKNIQGIFPETDLINKKIKSAPLKGAFRPNQSLYKKSPLKDFEDGNGISTTPAKGTRAGSDTI